jgi:hypothetical protein
MWLFLVVGWMLIAETTLDYKHAGFVETRAVRLKIIFYQEWQKLLIESIFEL